MEKEDAIQAREFLRALRVSPVEAAPAVEKLARWLEAALDTLDAAEVESAGYERDRVESYEQGRKHGLEQAQSLIDTEIEELQDEAERDTSLAEKSLERVWYEIDNAAKFCSDEYEEPDQLVDAPARKPQAAQPPAPREPRTLRDIALSMFDHPGTRLLRKEVVRHLMSLDRDPKVSEANAGGVIGGLVSLERLKQTRERVNGKSQNVLTLP